MDARAFLRTGLACFALAGFARADTIELMNGNRVEGKVLATDDAGRTVTVEAVVGGQTITRTLPQSQVHALTVGGQRKVLTPKPGGPAGSGDAPASLKSLTPAEVKTLIAGTGPTPPDWMKSTKLNYPKTLDLAWMPQPQGQWNNQKNVGQFIWDIINPNAHRPASRPSSSSTNPMSRSWRTAPTGPVPSATRVRWRWRSV